MSIPTVIFYVLACFVAAATAMAVTRRNLVHAVLYLVLSFFGSAMLFYLLGAPFLAMLEVIIYAGAIMVLFLFLIMMIQMEKLKGMFFPARQLVPAIVISAVFLVANTALMGRELVGWRPMQAAQASPINFGVYLFQTHWLAVEIASLLLLVALVGAFLLGLQVRRQPDDASEEKAS